MIRRASSGSFTYEKGGRAAMSAKRTGGQAGRIDHRCGLLVAVTLLGLLLAGCGSSSSSGTTSTSPSPTTTASTTHAATSSPPSTGGSAAKSSLSLEANKEGELKYNTTSLTAKAGNVSIDFTNMSSLSHNVTIESSSGQTVGATPTFSGGSKTLSVNLKPGTYKFFCSVPGHRQAGMEGTLTVQ
jgi:plastocyanin